MVVTEKERVRSTKLRAILAGDSGDKLLSLAEKGEIVINSRVLAEVLGISRNKCNGLIDEFLEVVQSDKKIYPQYSVIKPSQKIRIVWFLPFIHFYTFRSWFGTIQEKFIPKYSVEFFKDLF